MKVYRWPEGERPDAARRVVAVGAFDGVHLGHQQVLASLCRAARERSARACVITFEPTPAQIFAPGPPQNLRLTPDRERLELLSRLCIDEVCVLDFSRQRVRGMTAAEFLAHVVADWLGGVAVCGAPSHRLGSDRVAWPEVVELARSAGLEAIEAEMQLSDERVISSTEIRRLVWDGRVDEAAGMLGRDYTVTAKVVAGRGLGRELGFPTANLQPPPEKLLPADGVYAGWCSGGPLGRGPLGQPSGAWPAAINVGTCPTLGQRRERSVEVHIIGWSGEALGATITAGVISRLRAEQRFATVAELRAQIAADVQAAQAIAREHAVAAVRRR